MTRQNRFRKPPSRRIRHVSLGSLSQWRPFLLFFIGRRRPSTTTALHFSLIVSLRLDRSSPSSLNIHPPHNLQILRDRQIHLRLPLRILFIQPHSPIITFIIPVTSLVIITITRHAPIITHITPSNPKGSRRRQGDGEERGWLRSRQRAPMSVPPCIGR